METIQMVQITPGQLAALIREELKPELSAFVKSTADNQPSKKEFLTREETAEFFQITKTTLHDWVKRKIVTPYKMGNRTYFRYNELVETLMSSNRRGK